MATPVLCKGCGQVHDPLRACPRPQPVCPQCLARARKNREVQREFRKRQKAKEEMEAKVSGMELIITKRVMPAKGDDHENESISTAQVRHENVEEA